MSLLELDADTGLLLIAAGAAVTRVDGDRYEVSDGCTSYTFDLACPVYTWAAPAAAFAGRLRAAAEQWTGPAR